MNTVFSTWLDFVDLLPLRQGQLKRVGILSANVPDWLILVLGWVLVGSDYRPLLEWRFIAFHSLF